MQLLSSLSFKQQIRATLLLLLLGTTVVACSNAPLSESDKQEQTATKENSQVVEAEEPKPVEALLLEVQEQRVQTGAMMMKESGGVQHRAIRQAPALLKPLTFSVPENTENYQNHPENSVWTVAQQPFSTFSVDVDTASYSNVRRMLNRGILPPKDAVRVEEFINYFNYDYPRPNARDGKSQYPFHLDISMTESPYNKDRHLVRVALSGKEIENASRAESNLVFLLDVSGSMSSDNKLPLLKRALKLMLSKLDERDTISIVVYAGSTGVVLEPTSGADKFAISEALDRLQAGGSTNGASGIKLAYKMARKAFKKDGVNRVILATDGDFNVGITDQNDLMDLIVKQRESGVYLSVLGFGAGNYNDHLTEQLADKGNGNAAYIDNINEARKVLVEQLTGTLQVIAKDVKIQVEFNPDVVHEYRLIGYENRVLAKEDFNNDKVDAGDIGAGHQVTALYEITLNSAKNYRVDQGRYQKPKTTTADSDEIAYVKLRYKAPDSGTSQLINSVVSLSEITSFQDVGPEYKFASSVAGFAQILRNSKFVDKTLVQQLIDLARSNKGDDPQGYRIEFIKLMETWQLLHKEEVYTPMERVDKLHQKPVIEALRVESKGGTIQKLAFEVN